MIDYKKKYLDALERANSFQEKYGGDYAGYIFPELRESEDERIRKRIHLCLDECVHSDIIRDYERDECLAYLEKQKEQKPIIQDVELNDAVYDYVRDHFIAGADFTPEYIKKLMENAFFAGVDYYLLKQESESCEPDTNVEKVIEDVIRVYGKTQGEWVGGYDVDTLIVNLRRAFNKKEQKPAEWSKEDEMYLSQAIETLEHENYSILADKLKSLRPQPKQEWSEEDEKIITRLIGYFESFRIAGVATKWEGLDIQEVITLLKSLRNRPKSSDNWKPSEEQIYSLGTVVKGAGENSVGSVAYNLKELYEQLKRLKEDEQ